MKRYEGSCHCGRVRFEIEAELDHVRDCDCSVCRRRGALNHRISRDKLRLLTPWEDLVLYQWGSRTAQDFFCPTCGILPFRRPSDPTPAEIREGVKPFDGWAVNVRCLEDVDLDSLPVRRISGSRIVHDDDPARDTGNTALPGSAVNPAIHHFDEGAEYYFAEGCYITELSNSPDDPAASVARARVEPGVVTRWHRLEGIAERYVVLAGRGRVEAGGLPPTEVAAGDAVVIPPMTRQRIANIGGADLIFLAICTPRFVAEAYRDG